MLWLNWGWIGICAACLVAGFIGGCQHNHREIDRLLAAGEAQNDQTTQTIKHDKQIAQEVKNDYQTRITAIRSAYRVRTPGSGLVPPATQAPGGTDGTAAYAILAEQCTETTQQLVSLQDFIKETE